MKKCFYRRYGPVIVVLLTLATPALIFGALRALRSNANSVRDWLPPSFTETQRLDWFIERFYVDEILMVSWPGCTLDDERTDELADRLLAPAPLKDGSKAPYFRRAYTGPSMYDRLVRHPDTDEPLELTEEEIFARMQGWILGPDHDATCVLALVGPAGRADRHSAVDWVYECAGEIGLDVEELRVAGSTLDGVAIDRISSENLTVLNAMCWAVCIAVACVVLRSWQIALMVFGTALMSQLAALSTIYYTGTQMSAVLLMVGSLVFVLGISASVHLVNYYRDAIVEGGRDGAAARAVAYAWLPCSLAAITTALGLVSLTVSKIVPIYRFGIYAAAGVVLGLGLLMLALPTWLEWWPTRRWAQRAMDGSAASGDGNRWRPWAAIITRWHAPITVGGVVLLAAAGYGATKVRTAVNLHRLFGPEARVLQDYEWLQERVGPLVPMEVVLRFEADESARMIDRMILVEQVRRAILGLEHVGGTISAGTFGPNVPEHSSAGGVFERTYLERRLREHRESFVEGNYLYDDDAAGEELWRISVRVEAQKNLDYGHLLDQLERQVRPMLADQAERYGAKVEAEFCGGVPLVNQAQNQLLTDLIWSFLTAFALVGVTMMVLLRSVSAGALSMIPNVLPAVGIFGAMGWAGTAVEIGAMLTASTALGIAVDDTLHFITWFRRSLADGHDRPTAVLEAFGRCGTAMTQTTLICTTGLFVYVASPFVPTSRFAWLMFAMLSAALAADLIVLPAILVGPLGRFFERGSKSTTTPGDGSREGEGSKSRNVEESK